MPDLPLQGTGNGHARVGPHGPLSDYVPEPPPFFHLSRPRLLEQLNHPYQAPVTLVTAEAGYGKTTLGATWARQAASPVCWLTLRQMDNDPAVFAGRLRFAMQAGGDDGPVPWQDDAPLANVRALLQHRTDACMLVLDNAHLIRDDGALDVLHAIVESVSPQHRLLVLSRQRLPLRLGRLRAEGRLREVQAEDLRFTEDEAAAVLRRQVLPAVDDALVRETWLLAEGWITGIRLGGMALRMGRLEPGEAGRDERAWHGFIDEYVREEVLDPLAPELRAFVLHGADLPYLSVDLATALFGAEGPELLDRVRHEMGFITSLGPLAPGSRLRLHGLVRQSLRRLASGLVPVKERRAFQRQALDLFQAQDDHEGAAELALETGEGDAITPVMVALCAGLADRSDFPALGRWLDRIPSDLVRADPHLSYWRVMTRLGLGRIVGTSDVLDTLEPGWLALGDPLFAGRSALCRGMLGYHLNRPDDARAHLERAGALLPATALVERLYATTFLGRLAFRAGDDQAAMANLAEAGTCAASLPIEEQWSWRVIAPDRANAYALRGDLASAVTKYRMMLAEMPPVQAHVEGLLRVRLAGLAIERNDLAGALHELDLVDALPDRETATWRHDAVVARARLLLAQGKREDADRWASGHVKSMRRLPEKNQLVLLLARIWVERGEFPLVRSWLQDLGDEHYPWIDVFGDISSPTLAIDLDLATGNLEQAVRAAETLARGAAATRRWADFILYTTRHAVGLHLLDQRARAQVAFHEALARAIPGGFARSLQVPGFDTTWLFADLWADVREGQRTRRSLQAAPAESPVRIPSPLTLREIEVLALVAEGRSNQEIADAMYISANTVRNHLVKIARRLGARSRVAAVTRARELGLLD